MRKVPMTRQKHNLLLIAPNRLTTTARRSLLNGLWLALSGLALAEVAWLVGSFLKAPEVKWFAGPPR
jgi:hypothetical protein